jgi:predicted esterase
MKLLLKPLILLAVIFVTALFWAKARDPFRRVNFSIHTKSDKAEAITVLPNRNGPFPIAIYAHGAGDDILRDGKKLRLMAEQGLAAVSFEYDQTNQANFDAQMETLLSSVNHSSWAQTNSVAWIGESLGAQRMLSFLIRHPEYQPELLVRISGGWIEDLNNEGAKKKPETSIKTRVMLIHGEKDEVFPIADCRRIKTWFETNEIPVLLHSITNMGHNFTPYQPLLYRAAAEWCAEQFASLKSQQTTFRPLCVNRRPTYWWYWIPVGLLCLPALGMKICPHFAQSLRYGNRPLLIISLILAVLASGYSAIHLGLPQLRPSSRVVEWTRSVLVRHSLRDDFDWLTQQAGMTNQKIGTLLQHLELANYNRNLVGWKVEDSIYREFVLSPKILPEAEKPASSEQIRWRRILWESFYPRIRHENSPEGAAQIVVRFLRERVTISSKSATGQSIPEMWKSGVATPDGFERLYVAALRSVGIAAKLNTNGQSEMCVDGQWQPAPRPKISEIESPAKSP